MKSSYHDTPAFFGAANSFGGFKSNFNKIFPAQEYERIYILKGGPGTGKNTLMRNVSKSLYNRNAQVIRLFCSSDPNSLDGVIISNKSKKIAIIDGTYPHTTDPEYPGAIDTIINLGEGFKLTELMKRKTDIIDISNHKKACYRKAYEYLETCGKIYERIIDKIRESKINSEAEWLCEQVLGYELFKKKFEKTTDNYLIGAFCKDGYVKLNVPCIEKEYISLIGDGFTEQIVMNMLFDKLNNEESIDMICRSALTAKRIDVMVTDSCVISTDNIGCTVIDTTPLSTFLDNEYRELCSSYESILELSRQNLKNASQYHFMLEDIYKINIDFGFNERMTEKIISESSAMLFR